MNFIQGHALLIGIGSYQHHPRLNVPITVADAQQLADIVRDSDHCGYPDSQIQTLHDAKATRAAILKALDDLASCATEQDTVLLFYCGHGDYGADGQYYLTSHDTQLVAGKVVQGTGVSQRELLEKLQAIRAHRVLLLFNACHSGALSPTLDLGQPFASQNPPAVLSSALLATGEGRVIITACRSGQLSYIGSGKQTIFTQALVDGLRGIGVPDRDGYISLFDLYIYVYHMVCRRVGSDFAAVQEPELTILKGVGPFAVACHPGTAVEGGTADVQAESTLEAALRRVEPAESQAHLQWIQAGGVNFGQDTTVTVQGSVVGGDQHSSTFGGNQLRADSIDQRQGVVVSGGTVSGTIVGFNQGMMTIADGTPTNAASVDPIEDVLVIVEQAAAQAQQRGDEDLALDLQGVSLSLQAALKAQRAANTKRQQAKVREAQTALQAIAVTQPELAGLARSLAAQFVS